MSRRRMCHPIGWAFPVSHRLLPHALRTRTALYRPVLGAVARGSDLERLVGEVVPLGPVGRRAKKTHLGHSHRDATELAQLN